MLRPYQIEAVDAATSWMRRSIMPACMELATGAGKSWVLAYIAKWVHEISGKKTLVLQPSSELVSQNHEKFITTGYKASIFSASAGGRCLRHNVVFATPQTVKNSISRFGDSFGAVLIDECHMITPTIISIVDAIRLKNKNLRAIGVSATPYRTQTGYIFQYDVDGSFVPEDQARGPWFNTLLYRIQTRELIDMGFLTPAHADPDHAASYDAGGLVVNRHGKFDAADIERVFEGRGRLTADIVADVVRHSVSRRGVMLFAATVQHAQEIMESLPPENSRMIGGTINMGRADRKKLVDDFKAQRFKYLVSVGTLTTGFDAPHVDVVSVLRATESPGLFQQIIGRGLRLYDGKDDLLVLDYAGNIERHQLHGDLFAPQIRVKGSGQSGAPAQIECPDCGFHNEFSLRPDYIDMDRDVYGYVLDLEGAPIETENGPMPAHFGRRCTGQVPVGGGMFERCNYRWTFKPCLECDHENDIAARYCESCKSEIIDPNEKLQREFIRVKKDPYSVSTDAVLEWSAHPHMTQKGDKCLRCEYRTEYRSFQVYYSPEWRFPAAVRAWESLSRAVFRGHLAPDVDVFLQHIKKGSAPTTITYRKTKSGMFEALDHNRPEDKLPE